MKNARITRISVALVSLAAATVGFASGAQATDSVVSRACADNTNVYHGSNYLYYYYYDANYFLLDHEDYSFSPALAASTHNNQNMVFFGGSSNTTVKSPDTLIRDNTKRVDKTQHDFGSITGSRGLSNATWTDIFDVPNASDPSCTTKTGNF